MQEMSDILNLRYDLSSYNEEDADQYEGKSYGVTCILGTAAAAFEILIYLAIYPLLMTAFITIASVLVGTVFKSRMIGPVKGNSADVHNSSTM